jgi:hypothetical protein
LALANGISYDVISADDSYDAQLAGIPCYLDNTFIGVIKSRAGAYTRPLSAQSEPFLKLGTP